MKKMFYRFLIFSFMVSLLILSIKVLNMIPQLFSKDTIKEYRSVEEMRRTLGLRYILTPKYFPESISWPPSHIYAQKRPYVLMIMSFKDESSSNIRLVIYETERYSIVKKSSIENVKDELRYDLKGREAILRVGTCRKTESCSEIIWRENGLWIKLFILSPPFVLVRIAESMLP